ncbi:MAG: hypothetical protein WC730_03405 [Patescibacteria group bacterium]|jgi:hypothetical protein
MITSLFLSLFACSDATILEMPEGSQMAFLEEYLRNGPCGQSEEAPCEAMLQEVLHDFPNNPRRENFMFLRVFPKGYPQRGVSEPQPKDRQGIIYSLYPPFTAPPHTVYQSLPQLGMWKHEPRGCGEALTPDPEMLRLLADLQDDEHYCGVVPARGGQSLESEILESTGEELEHQRCKLRLRDGEVVIEGGIGIVFVVDPMITETTSN